MEGEAPLRTHSEVDDEGGKHDEQGTAVFAHRKASEQSLLRGLAGEAGLWGPRLSTRALKAAALGLGLLAVVVAVFIYFGGGEDGSEESGQTEQQSGDALEDLDQPGQTTPDEQTSPAEPTSAAEPQPVESGPAAEPDYAALNETQQQRVRGAVSGYIVGAYGYTGSDPTEYARRVESNVILPDFYYSEGGQYLKERIGQVKDGKVEGAAVLERFEIQESGDGEVVGTAYFSQGRSYDESGVAIEGGGTSYSERFTLKPFESVYRIAASSGPQEVSQ